MTGESTFRTPDEEVRNLLHEIGEVKQTLRDISAKLTQLERHAKRVLAPPPKVARATDGQAPNRLTARAKPLPTVSEADALRLFDELTSLWRTQGSSVVNQRLTQLAPADLRFIAQQLGISANSKASKKTLLAGIIGRINESV